MVVNSPDLIIRDFANSIVHLHGSLCICLPLQLKATLTSQSKRADVLSSVYWGALTFMSWKSQHIPPAGKALGILGTGAVFGDTLFPLLVGVLLDKIVPVTLIYSIFTAAIASILVAGLMFLGSKIHLDAEENYLDLSATQV